MPAKLFAVVVVMFLALAFAMFIFIDSLDADLREATGLAVSTESFPTYLKTSPVMSSMPRSAAIGVKIGESFYEIDGKDIRKTGSLSDNNDVVVTLPEGYEEVIGELGLCGAAKKAYDEKKLDVKLYASKTMLLLKYAKLLKYSNCLSENEV